MAAAAVLGRLVCTARASASASGCCAVAARRGCRWRAAASAVAPEPRSAGSGGGLSATANSFISLGAFETMGGDLGRAATGIAYMEEALRLQGAAHEAEADPRRRSRKALSLAQTLLQLGRQHHQQQDPVEAIVHYERAVGLVEEFISLHTPKVAVEEEEPSRFAASDGGPRPPSATAQAKGAAKKAFEYARFVLTEVLSSLGVAYYDAGRPEEALEALQRALTLRKETVGKDHPSIAECLNNLGALFFARGALQKAAEHYEQALDRLIASAGGSEEGAYVALTLYNIGLCRAGLGHSREALAALRRALRLAESSLGPEHRQVELIRETIQQQQLPHQPEQPPPGGPPSRPAAAPDAAPPS